MSAPFPTADKKSFGYRREQVDEFLATARAAYEGNSANFGSKQLREAAFDFAKGGYRIADVDAALERLEEAFAARERAARIAEQGRDAVLSQARADALEIVGRLRREDGKRFRRAGLLREGYHPKDVDEFAAIIVAYFEGKGPLAIGDIRAAAFRSKTNGYDQAQVDALLDTVIEVLLAVKPA